MFLKSKAQIIMKHVFVCVILFITPNSFANRLPSSDFKSEIGGLIQIDHRWFDEAWSDSYSRRSDITLRRARLNSKGTIGKNVAYKLEVNFDKRGDVRVEDAFINFRQSHGDIYIGRMLEPFSLEGITSPKWNTAIELSPIASAVSPGRSIGILYRRNLKKMMFSLGVFDNGRRDKIRLNGVREETITPGENNHAFSGRLSYRPFRSQSSLLHLGAAYSYRETKSTKFEINTNGSAFSESPVFTHTFTRANKMVMLGLESILISNAFSMQAEYLELDVDDSSSIHNFNLSGWYLLASYFITGEKRNYKAKTGDFGAIVPKTTSGAIEVFSRYSKVDTNSKGISQFDSVTSGVNYYVNDHTKLSFNAITREGDNSLSKQTYLFRFQIVY